MNFLIKSIRLFTCSQSYPSMHKTISTVDSKQISAYFPGGVSVKIDANVLTVVHSQRVIQHQITFAANSVTCFCGKIESTYKIDIE